MTLVTTVGTKATGNPSSLTSPSLTVQVGDLLIAWVIGPFTQSASAYALSSSGDTWVTALQSSGAQNDSVGGGYCLSATAGTKTVTATPLPGSWNNDVALVVQQFRPTSGYTVSLDVTPVTTAQSFSAGAKSSAAFTTTGAGVIATGFGWGSSGTTPVSGVTIGGTATTIDFQDANTLGGSGQSYTSYRLTSGALSSIQAVWTTVDGGSGEIGVMAFKEQSSGVSVNVSESLATSDTFGITMTTPVSITDSLTTSDVLSSSAIFKPIITESMATSDTFSATVIFNVVLSDSASTSDSFGSNGGSTYSVSIAESVAATDSLSASTIASVVVGESVIATDTLSSKAIFAVSVSESAAATDSPSSSAIYRVSMSEAASIADAISIGGAGAMPQINIGGIWKTVNTMYLNVGGTWKTVATVQVDIGGTWKATS
jgi:hypothetical protein